MAPGQFETCTGTYTATAQDAADNNVTNRATATGTDAAGATSPVSPPVTLSIPQTSPAPTVEIHKSASVTPSSDQDGVVVGDHISYTYIVTNTGNVNLSSVAVDDPTAGSVTCPALTSPGLTPGASVTCTEDIAYQVTQSDVDAGSVTNAATATGTATIAGKKVTSPASAPASVTIPAAVNPVVSIFKSAVVTPAADQNALKPGDTLQYSYLVTNIGDTTLSSISVSDPSVGHVTCPTPASPGLAPGSAETCSADNPYVVTQPDVDAGAVNDTAAASGIDLLGTPSPAASGSLTVAAEPAHPELSLLKQGTDANATDQNDIKVGDTIDYTYTVTNTGDVTLATFSVIDPTLGPLTCPTVAPPGLAPGASASCTGDEPYSVTQANIDAGGASDVAAAIGADANSDSTPTATAHETDHSDRDPQVSLTKIASVTPAADQSDAQIGDVIAYSFLITNTGNVDLTSVAVSDPSLGAVSCPIPAPPGLAPEASETCTGELQHVVTAADQSAGKVTNTATATGTDAAGDTSAASGSSSTTVPVAQAAQPPAPAPPPASEPTAKLAVTKHVSAVNAYPGQKLTYTLTVTNDGPSAATDVTLSDTPTIAIKVDSIHSSTGSCQRRATLTCVLGTLAPGVTVTITIVGEVEHTGTERNTARATSATQLVDPSIAVATATTKIAPILRIRKTASVRRATTGQNVTYTIVVTNPTLVAIRRIAVCDTPPTGLLYLSSRPDAKVRTGQPCWTISSLRAGHSRRFVVVVNVAPGHGGRLVNRARASAPGVRTARAGAAVDVTQASQLPCGVASQASATDREHPTDLGPVARAAC